MEGILFEAQILKQVILEEKYIDYHELNIKHKPFSVLGVLAKLA